MNLMPLGQLGCRQNGRSLEFGVYLPMISGDRYTVEAAVIHTRDQFGDPSQPKTVSLRQNVDPVYGEYWSGAASLDDSPQPGSAWGQAGRYVYWYRVSGEDGRVADQTIDPFAREFGPGKRSAISVDYEPYVWSEAEADWRTPAQRDLVIYEINLAEFAHDIEGAIERLGHLRDLGINCVEIMPVTGVAAEVDWGYVPFGYFGVDERLGQRRDLQAFIDAAHRSGMAVIADVVYGHTSGTLAYSYLYRALGIANNPVLGSFGDHDWFGESTDWSRPFTQDFFYTANAFWLENFHLDGFRYDCVPNYYAGAFSGYGALCYATHELVASKRGEGGHWSRFFPDDGSINLMQCAEQLEKPIEVLQETYSTATWQDATFGAATDVAWGAGAQRLADLGIDLGLPGYPVRGSAGAGTMAKTAVQYIENHDHWRFVCNFSVSPEQADVDLFVTGDRSRWYRLQPYLIGLLTAKGIPLLYQGQEFGENYTLPGQGIGRVALLRPMRWDYFYDDTGRRLMSLVRRLIALRRSLAQLRSDDHYFYNDPEALDDGVLLYSRYSQTAWTLVALNFTDADRAISFRMPVSGDYREELHGQDLTEVDSGADTRLIVPSNYGRLWTAPTAVPPRIARNE